MGFFAIPHGAIVDEMQRLPRLLSYWQMLLAGRISQAANMASLAHNMGASAPTLRQWLSVLMASYPEFELPRGSRTSAGG